MKYYAIIISKMYVLTCEIHKTLKFFNEVAKQYIKSDPFVKMCINA